MVKSPRQVTPNAPKSPVPSSELDYTLYNPNFRPSPLRRIAVGGFCLALGLGAAAAGLSSVYYRLTHMTVDAAIINARTIRIQAPIDGTLQDFYGRPGVPVRSGQVLAQLKPLARAEEGQLGLAQLQRQVDTTTADLTLARQTLALLQQQQRDLARQDRQVQQATVTVATDDLNRHRASLEAAIAEERAAQSDYARFQSLLEEGAVSEQQVDQLEAEWKAAQAAVKEAQATLESGRTLLTAARTNIPMKSGLDDLQSRRQSLEQQVQQQQTAVERLTVTLANRRAELEQFEALHGDDETVQVTAPISGVIHSTRYETGEQVNRPVTLLRLLDCNDLWVETIVNANRANQIDTDKPVRIKLAGVEQTLTGEVAVIEAMSKGKLTDARTEAILPAIPTNLINQPIARVRVSLPSTEDQFQSNQFCGLGQNAQLTFGMTGWGSNL